LHADKVYDCQRCRAYLWQRGITSRTARRSVEGSERPGRHRRVVQRTHGWFAGSGKLRIRFARRLVIHRALLSMNAAVICPRLVGRSCWRFWKRQELDPVAHSMDWVC